ncbi:MAG: hypothetical protein KAQ93_00790 [Spirochaetales bacterium]|nr:hypothetical protein [Spirochaetales bacterium]
MKSITIHGIDDITSQQLQIVAEKLGLSLNKTIKRIIQEALGIKPAEISSRRSDFEEFCGIWSEEDLQEFTETVKPLRQINPEEWK